MCKKINKNATSDNTAYTLRASPLPFGTFCYRKTSYMMEPLGDIVRKEVKNDRIERM